MRRRSPTMIALIAAALLCQGCLEVSGARHQGPAPSAADRRWFARSCDALWPEAVRVLTSEGFRLVGRDPGGAIASFMWADERRLNRLRAAGDLEQFVAREDGLSGDARSARVESAVLETVPKNRGCEVRLRISFTARRSSLGFKRGWVSLSSSGRFEERLLARIGVFSRGEQGAASGVPPRIRAPLATVARAASAEATPSWQDPTGPEHTRVVRLEGEN